MKNEKYIDRLIAVMNVMLKDGSKSDLDSQIKAIETLNENLIKTPLFISIISSLKELKAIKRNRTSENQIKKNEICRFWRCSKCGLKTNTGD